MNLADHSRTTSFRWTLGIAAALVLQSCAVALVVFATTVSATRARMDADLLDECRTLSQLPQGGLLEEIAEKVDRDVHRLGLVGLFTMSGAPLAGNIKTVPSPLLAKPGPFTLSLTRTEPANLAPDSSRTVACNTASGDRLVVARDTDDIEALRNVVERALALTVVPALAIAVLLGVILGRRGQTRFQLVRSAIDDVMNGDLSRRLPEHRSRDPFDRLSRAVNDMLDRLEVAVEDVRAMGDDIAHAVRTPLTRLRARLERRLECEDPPTLADINDRAIADIDHVLAIVSAILRVRTIEATKRDSHFVSVDAGKLLTDASELYRPLADEKGIDLSVDAPQSQVVTGDRDLLMEALCNLIDNAIKFTPAGGSVRCRIVADGPLRSIEVVDNGPGIREEDRKLVTRRFRRGSEHVLVEGYGIGLSLVYAITCLHGFALRIDDARPGCRIAIDIPKC